jgi:hypothetical protein
LNRKCRFTSHREVGWLRGNDGGGERYGALTREYALGHGTDESLMELRE